MKNNKEIPHRIHRFRVRVLDIEAGKNIAILNEEEATYNDIYISDRVSIKCKGKEVISIIDTSETVVKKGDVAIYKDIAKQLKVKDGDIVEIQHIPVPKSLEYIKRKMDRETLNDNEIFTIVKETVENRLNEGELASFIAAAYINGFGIGETVALAKAMVETGTTLDLGVHPIADKHCLAGDVPVLIKNSGEAKVVNIGDAIDKIFDRCKPDEIINDDGAEFTNKNLNGLQTLVFDDEGNVSFKPVSGVFRVKAPDKLYKISLVGNRNIAVTSDHTVFILKNGRITNIMAKELKVGDYVVVPSGFKNENKEKLERISIGEKEIKIDRGFMRFLGYYLAEGFTNSQGIFLNFGSHEKELIEDAVACVKHLFGKEPTINRPHKTAIRICIYNQKLAKEFEKLKAGSDALNKQIPSFIFDLDEEMKKEFIKALFAGDGYVRRGYEAIYVTSSKNLAIGLQYLLSLMGCSATLSMSAGKKRKFPKQTAMTQDSYYVYTQARQIFGERKKANVSFLNLLPVKEIGEIDKNKIDWRFRKLLKEQKYITKEKLSRIMAHIKSEDVRKFIRGQLSVLRIKRIELIKPNTEYVYDIKVDDYHRFMAGTAPIAVHNCIGGVAGNRTTMLIVPILAAAGVYIPKTSSRAISSASGTADTFEVFAPVVLPVEELRKVVLKTHGCIAWGGAINLAPVDDKLIRIRNSLHLDPKGLLLASILGKKKAVGAEYLIVDIPVGRGAKVENESEGKLLANDFLQVSEQLGIKTRCLITDGSDPIGFGIGPGLESLEVLKALKMKDGEELREKSCLMAGSVLEMLGKAPVGKGADYAFDIIKSGKAYEKFKEIVEAQGGNPNVKEDDIPIGHYRYVVKAEKSGRVSHVDNKYVNKIARVAGAPKDKGAGVILHCEMGDKISAGDILFEIVSESETKLSFAIEMANAIPPVELQKVIIGKVE